MEKQCNKNMCVKVLGVAMAKNPFEKKIDFNLSDNRMDCTKGLNYTSFFLIIEYYELPSFPL